MQQFIIVQNKELVIPCDYVQSVIKESYSDKIQLGVVIDNKYSKNSYYTLSPSKCTNSDCHIGNFILNIGEYRYKDTTYKYKAKWSI